MSLPKRPQVLFLPMSRFVSLNLMLVALLIWGCNNKPAVAKPTLVEKQVVKRPIKVTVIEEGHGKPLLEGDTLYLEYELRAAGEEIIFDQNNIIDSESGANSTPYTLTIGLGVGVEGLEEALLNSRVGDKKKIFIPYEKAYGDRGVTSLNIPAKQDLEFIVKVLDVIRIGEEEYYDVQDIKVGSGLAVKNGDKIVVHYRGTYVNGRRFDDTRLRGDIKKGGTAHQFKVGGGYVIPGFDLGVVGMKVGGKRMIKVPPILAFANAGYGAIQGGQILLFEVDLLAIN